MFRIFSGPVSQSPFLRQELHHHQHQHTHLHQHQHQQPVCSRLYDTNVQYSNVICLYNLAKRIIIVPATTFIQRYTKNGNRRFTILSSWPWISTHVSRIRCWTFTSIWFGNTFCSTKSRHIFCTEGNFSCFRLIKDHIHNHVACEQLE